jgi:hypothetical protein
LQRGCCVTDLVEQHRARSRLLEYAFVVRHGTRERPALVPEQLRLEQRVGYRPAIDGDEGFPCALAVTVDRTGDELLSRPAFPDDEDGGSRIGGVRDLFVHLQHWRCAADEATHGTSRRLGRLGLMRPLSERAFNHSLHIGDDERLADVVECPRAHRFDRSFKRAKSADQQHRRALVCPESVQQIESRAWGVQIDVRDQQVERVGAHLHQRRI